jgi:hypothetical protein
MFVVLALWPIAAWSGLNLWRLIRYIGAEILLVIWHEFG